MPSLLMLLMVCCGKKEGLFIIQTPQEWLNLVAEPDQCCVLVIRPSRIIYMAWYAQMGSGMIVGIRVKQNSSMRNNDAKWENVVQWWISEFEFRPCPIYQLDILTLDEDGCLKLGSLWCKVKTNYLATVLTRWITPLNVHRANHPYVL